jgi:tRNA threonylcarbamoyladenosine biosynthesis protein TsaB
VIVLAVHTTTPRLSAAIVRDGRILREKILPPGREHLENLALVVQDIVNQAKMKLEDMDGFGVAIGPGSFSGIRVGLATVKGMALALGKPAVGISSLETLAWSGLAEGEAAASVIDARRREIFVGLYRKRERRVLPIEGPFLIKVEQFDSILNRFNHDGLAICTERVIEGLAVNNADVFETRIVIPSAGACALLAEESLRTGDSVDVHSIAPLYIRRPDAEEKLKV